MRFANGGAAYAFAYGLHEDIGEVVIYMWALDRVCGVGGRVEQEARFAALRHARGEPRD